MPDHSEAEVFQRMVEHSTDMLSRHAAQDGRYLYASPASKALFGYEPDELVNLNPYTLFHPEDIPAIQTSHETVLNTSMPYTVRYRIKAKSGEWRWVETTNRCVRDENTGDTTEILCVTRDITDRLQEREHLARQSLALENMWEAVVVTDEQGLVSDWNRAAELLFGYSREEMLGQETAILQAEQRSEDLYRIIRENALTDDHWSGEVPIRRKDGSTRYVETQIAVLRDPDGTYRGMVSASRDITERKQKQEEVAQSESRFRSLVQHSSDVIMVLDSDGRITYVSDTAVRLTGRKAEDWIGRQLFDFVPIDQRNKYYHSFRAGRTEFLDGATLFELPITRPSGGSMILEAVGADLREDPDVCGFVINCRDITERKRVEHRLRLLATAIRDAEEAVLITDANLDEPGPKIVFVNEGFTIMSGYKPEEVIGNTPRMLQGPKTSRKMLDRLKSELRAGHSFAAETTNYRKDGSEYVVEWHISPVTDPTGMFITHYVSIQRDITERKRAEERLMKSEARLAEAQSLARIGSWEYDQEEESFDWSDTAYAIFEMDQDMGQLDYQQVRSRLVEKDRETLDQAFQDAAVDGVEFEFDTQILLPNGAHRDIHIIGQPGKDSMGRYTRIVGTFHDITTRKQTEAALRASAAELEKKNRQLEQAGREAERAREAVEQAAEELGQAYEDAAQARRTAEEANEAKSMFLANMSHEIRTPLTAILGFARLFRDKESDEESIHYLDHIISSGEHLLQLINDILDLSRVESGRLSLTPKPVNLTRLVDEIDVVYRPLAEQKSLEMIVIHDPVDQRVMIDRGRVRQVIANLLGNAIKFTQQGTVSLTVQPVLNRTSLEIVVKDTGSGIPREQQNSIFDPFFQVRESGKAAVEGTGLGLAITLRLIRAMGGAIALHSEEGEGSKFRVRIPCEFTSDEETEIPDGKAISAGEENLRSLHVLVADDHEANRTLIDFTLKKRGHRGILVEDGAKAIEAFKQNSFDLLVIDVQMPNVDGYEAIRRIRELPGGREVPIICLTAFAMKGDREKSLAAGADDYISKPFDPSRLAARIEAMGCAGKQSEIGEMQKDNAESSQTTPGFDADINPSVRKDPDPEMAALQKGFLESVRDDVHDMKLSLPSLTDCKVWGHRLAGSGGSFGFAALSALGRDLEEAALAEDASLIQSRLERIAMQVEADLTAF
ncbi:PAS domain S-box protein [bacterium]|nr:PAS domain S-box protein [bacterium]